MPSLLPLTFPLTGSTPASTSARSTSSTTPEEASASRARHCWSARRRLRRPLPTLHRPRLLLRLTVLRLPRALLLRNKGLSALRNREFFQSHSSDALYQGTTLVGPHSSTKLRALSPCQGVYLAGNARPKRSFGQKPRG